MLIGTAQFGLPYGITNQEGHLSLAEVQQILDTARSHHIYGLDTAAMYGNAERVIGEAGSANFNIISKLKPLNDANCNNLEYFVRQEIASSLEHTRKDRFYGYLVHQVDNLVVHGRALWKAMEAVREAGLTEKIGYSLYSPKQLEQVFSRFLPDLVQLPMNILDREFHRTGWLKRLKENGVEVHVRSAFLQGLLLIDAEAQAERFPAYKQLWSTWQAFLHEQRISALEACLGFLNTIEEIDEVVVGVTSAAELEQILQFYNSSVEVPESLSTQDPLLIYPYNWK